MRMLKENFEEALKLAIEAQATTDKARGIAESIFARGLRKVLEASRAGKPVYIVDP